MLKNLCKALFCLALLFTTGCVAPVAINYSPSSALSKSGKIDIGNFEYLPSKNGEVKPNQIQNSAIGKILITDNIEAFVANATKIELKNIGYNLNTGSPIVSGRINKLKAGDLGYSIDWEYDVVYFIKDKNGKLMYEKPVYTTVKANKFVSPFGGMSQVIRKSVDELISDPKTNQYFK